MANDWTKIVIGQWKAEEIELNPGISLEELSLVEKTLGFVFPEDFNELYSKVNGFQNNDWRKNMFTIWPVNKILYEFNSSKDKSFIGFSDYLLDNHKIGFVKDQTGVFKYSDKPELIAKTFDEAIHLINFDYQVIYM